MVVFTLRGGEESEKAKRDSNFGSRRLFGAQFLKMKAFFDILRWLVIWYIVELFRPGKYHIQSNYVSGWITWRWFSSFISWKTDVRPGNVKKKLIVH